MNIFKRTWPVIPFLPRVQIRVIINSTLWTLKIAKKEGAKRSLSSLVLSKNWPGQPRTSLETSAIVSMDVSCLSVVSVSILTLCCTGVKWKRFLILRESDRPNIQLDIWGWLPRCHGKKSLFFKTFYWFVINWLAGVSVQFNQIWINIISCWFLRTTLRVCPSTQLMRQNHGFTPWNFCSIFEWILPKPSPSPT